MISISTPIKDLNGNVIIKDRFDFRDNIARTTRVRTLDGGVVMNHFGVSSGDLTLLIRSKIEEADSNKLWNIFNNYTKIILSVPYGIFLATISRLSIDNGALSMTILVEQKENE